MKSVFVLCLLFLLVACSSLPVIGPAGSPGGPAACPQIFASTSVRFIHAIEVQAAGKPQTVVIGVTSLEPASRTISSAIVTPEGLSLFEATSISGNIQVNRALPPFDAVDFAQNMMDDIALIFLPPQGILTSQGRLTDERAVCRWHLSKGGWVDISKDAAGRHHIERYSEGGRLQREVVCASAGSSLYDTIELKSSGLIDYTLILNLIEFNSAADETQPPAPGDKASSGKAP